MKLTVFKVLFALVFAILIAGAIKLLTLHLWGAAAVLGVLAAMFGVFVVRDIRKALE